MEKISIDDIIKQAKLIKQQSEKGNSDESVKAYESKADDVKKFNIQNDSSSNITNDKTAVIPKISDESKDKTIKVRLTNQDVDSDKTMVMPKQERTRIVPKVTQEQLSEHTMVLDDNPNRTKKIDIPSNKDRPAIISTNSELDEKSDLHRIPTIFAVNHLDDAFKYHNSNSEIEEEIGVQMTLDGFDDEVDVVPSIDEEMAEKALKKNREDKINKFRLFGPDETDKKLSEEKVVDDDYMTSSDKSRILKNLSYTNSKTKAKLIITFVLGLLLVLMTAFKDKGFFPAFLSEHLVYFITTLILYVAILITNFNIIIHGFKFKGGINFDFVTSINAIIVLIHSSIPIFYEDLWLDKRLLLSSVAAFALFMSQLGKYKKLNQIINNFEYLTDNEDKFTIENITNEIDSKIISRGIIDEKPIIKTSVKTDFPTDFLDISCKTEPADKISSPLYFIMLLLSLILFLYIGFTNNFNIAFNILVCALCSTNPLIALYATNSALCDITNLTAKKGARICGYEGAQMITNSNAMVMEASDLFDRSCCDNHGIKIFNNTKIDDAILYTATVMIKTNSPLAHVFDDVIIGKQSILPEVEDIVYENKMGTSAWIYGKKVLVGNRDLLIAHGVNVPKESFEQKYTQKNKHALYLAVNGKICAMFVFSYSANPVLKQELKKLEKSGMTIIVRSCDPYINEEELCRLFDLPSDFIKVMNPPAARIYEKYSKMTVEKSPAYVIHNGTALSFVSAMQGAEDLISTQKLIKFLCTFGSIIGFGIIAFLSITNECSQITSMGTLCFHLIWSCFVVLASKLKKIMF